MGLAFNRPLELMIPTIWIITLKLSAYAQDFTLYRYGKFYRRRSALSHLALRSEFPDTFLPFRNTSGQYTRLFRHRLFYGLFERGNLMNPNLRMFLTVGFCGGFTTFSTFMNENFQLIKDDNFFYLSLYVGLSLFVGFIMLYLGYSLVKQ